MSKRLRTFYFHDFIVKFPSIFIPESWSLSVVLIFGRPFFTLYNMFSCCIYFYTIWRSKEQLNQTPMIIIMKITILFYRAGCYYSINFESSWLRWIISRSGRLASWSFNVVIHMSVTTQICILHNTYKIPLQIYPTFSRGPVLQETAIGAGANNLNLNYDWAH